MSTPERCPFYDTRPEAISARIQYFSTVFEVEPVAVRCAGGAALMTDDLVSWCVKNGASIDWIVAGDPVSMMRIYRLHRSAAGAGRAHTVLDEVRA